MSWSLVPLGELIADKTPSIDPAKHSDEEFELWSIPAFDAGAPEAALGLEIGSAKKLVKPHDVLLSRIVPHIRRSWVVAAPSSGRRQIASGEWIVFRSSRIYPPYLRHVLLSDIFHAAFMGTVAGVGGSLLRARPEAVKRIEVALPTLPEQRRIAAILDQADALRRMRRQSLSRLADVGQAQFKRAFGDIPGSVPLDDAVEDTLIGLVRGAEEFGDSFTYPYVRMDAITRSGKFAPALVQRTEATPTELARYALVDGDLLFNTRNSRELVGKTAIFRGMQGAVFNNNIMRIRFNPGWDPVFVEAYFRSRTGKHNLEQRKSGTTSVWAVYWSKLKSFPLPRVPFEKQVEFRNFIETTWAQEEKLQYDLMRYETLFASLQHRAFCGEL